MSADECRELQRFILKRFLKSGIGSIQQKSYGQIDIVHGVYYSRPFE